MSDTRNGEVTQVVHRYGARLSATEQRYNTRRNTVDNRSPDRVNDGGGGGRRARFCATQLLQAGTHLSCVMSTSGGEAGSCLPAADDTPLPTQRHPKMITDAIATRQPRNIRISRSRLLSVGLEAPSS
jgi:hypothetical protein